MLRSAMVGAGVAAACLLIPLVHFFTGIPSAFIGGYIAGARSSCTQGQAINIGLLMACILTLPVSGGGLLLLLIWPASLVVPLGLALVLWFGLSGALGAALGGASARRQTPS